MEYCDAEYPNDEAAGDDGSIVVAGVGDGPQAACALLPCENRCVILNFQFQDGSDGDVGLLLLRHPGLHDYGRCLSLSLSLLDDSDACCRCG